MGKYYRFEEKRGEKYLTEETWLGKIDVGKLEKDPWNQFVYRIHGPSGFYCKLEDKSSGKGEEFEVEMQPSLFSISEKGFLKRINGHEYEYTAYPSQEDSKHTVYPLTKEDKKEDNIGGSIDQIDWRNPWTWIFLLIFSYPLIIAISFSFPELHVVGWALLIPLGVLLAPLLVSIMYFGISISLPAYFPERWSYFSTDQWQIIFIGAGILVVIAWIIGIARNRKVLIPTYLLTGGFTILALLIEEIFPKLGVSSLDFLRRDISSFPASSLEINLLFQLFTFSCWILGIFALLSLIGEAHS
jgi:hypothetical protein